MIIVYMINIIYFIRIIKIIMIKTYYNNPEIMDKFRMKVFNAQGRSLD